MPCTRSDKGKTKISDELQAAVMECVKSNPKRSIDTLLYLLRNKNIPDADKLSRSALHRFYQQQQRFCPVIQAATTIEHRAFEAEFSNDIWYGDVMYGPYIQHRGKKVRTYLVSLMDDASRLLTYTAFCLNETATAIEGVLKQGILARGLPKKLVVDNGAAYRSHTLQWICAKLSIQLIYCTPYQPQGKAKLERAHKSIRQNFLNELDQETLSSLSQLNSRWWAWVEGYYHQQPHGGLSQADNRVSPIMRWQQDREKHTLLGPLGQPIDNLFYHRIERRVKKDGTVSWNNHSFEVPHGLSLQTVHLVVDPYEQRAMAVESGRKSR
jgi:transposase InsO family protein